MKICTLALFTLIVSFCGAFAQRSGGTIAVDYNAYTKVDPPALFEYSAELGTAPTFLWRAVYDASFLNEAKPAFERAMTIWSYLLRSNVQIVVRAKRDSTDFGPNELARAKPSYYSLGISLTDTAYYPAPLYEAKFVVNPNGNSPDIEVTVNSRYDGLWYYGTDGFTPTGKYDFLTVMMHELAHGFGFDHSFSVDSSNGFGRRGLENPPFRFPAIFDKFCAVGPSRVSFNRLTSSSYPDSSLALGQQLKSNNIFFVGNYTWDMAGGTGAKLYAPQVWLDGSSISHLDSATYRYGSSNSLMIPFRAKAEAVHSPGEIGLTMLGDNGWIENRITTFTKPAPGPNITSIARGDSLQLEWTDNTRGSAVDPVFADLMKRDFQGTYYPIRDLGSLPSYRGFNRRKVLIPSDIDSGLYKIRFLENATLGYGITYAFQVTLTGQVEKPSLNPLGGTYFNAINVSATCPNGTIRFDTTGAEPTESSPIYPSEGINLTSSKTIRAKGFATNLTPSAEARESYFIRYGSGASTGRIPVYSKIEAVQHASGYAFGSSSSDPYVGTATSLGGVSNPIARSFLIWQNLPSNVIPDSITSVTLEIFASYNGLSIPVRFVLTSGNTQDANALWNSVGTTTIESNVVLFDFGQSYTAGPLVAAVKQSLRGNRSLQIAVVSNNESQPNRYLKLDRSAGRVGYLTITYNVPTLRIAQVDSAGFSFGRWARWEGNQWRPYSDTTMPSPSATIFTLRADTNYKPATTQKYNVWRRNGVSDSTVNHTNMPVDPSVATVLAHFKPSKPATIQAQLIEGGTVGGTINFKDPWLIDDADSKGPKNRGLNAIFHNNIPSPFRPESSATYNGVFLNENPNFLPDRPNYSVGAPSVNTFTIGGQNYQAYFQGWTGNAAEVEYQYPNAQQTGVVFKQAGATATAKYKLHLRSSSASATAASTQRKVVRDNFGRYHAVYQSANAIFYTYSNDAGATWMPERMLSASLPEYPHRTPSIVYKPGTGGAQAEGAGEAEESEPHRIRVVWEAYTPDEYAHEIILCELDLNGNVTYGPAASHGWNGEGAASPVIGIAPNSVHPSYEPTAYYTLVAWYDGDWNAVRGFVWKPDNSISPSAVLAYNASQFSVAPYSNIENIWPLVYIEDNNVMYVPVAEGSTPAAGASELIHKGDESVIISSPNVSRVSNRVGVVWQAYYWEFVTGAVQYAERAGANSWTIPSGWLPYYSTSYYQKPTVTGSASQTNARLVFQEESPVLATVVGRPGAWAGVQSAGAGADPAMSTGYTGAASEMLISRGTQYPFAIQRQSLSLSAAMVESMSAVAEGRGGRLLYRNGSLHVAVLRAAINDTDVLFAALSDTARIGVGEFESALATEPFVGSGTLTLQMMFSGKGRVPNGAQMRMMVVDAETYQMVQQLRNYSPGNDSLHSLQISLSHGNRRVRLVLRPVGAGQPQGVSLERWYLPDLPQMVARKGNLHTPQMQQVPEDFALHANYPNPFNPTTTIKYDLPEDSHVSLVVYDVLGRKVAELVHGIQDAGFKSVDWNASSVASGMYLARFTAMDANGSVKLSKVMKLVLAK